jgi:rare lipoprotein A
MTHKPGNVVELRQRITATFSAETTKLGPRKARGGAARMPSSGRVSIIMRGHRAEPIHKPDGISAAHKSLPFGSIVDVRNQRAGRSIRVRINDRGPFIAGRIIDLSRGPVRVVGMNGLAPVE